MEYGWGALKVFHMVGGEFCIISTKSPSSAKMNPFFLMFHMRYYSIAYCSM